MKWNWQQVDWPEFRWDETVMEGLERRFQHEAGVALGAMSHVEDNEKQRLVVDVISNEAYRTSEIEGEMLDRASIQSSILRQLGLKVEGPKARAAERGVSEMMVDLYRRHEGPLKHERLFKWQAMLMGGRRGLADVGRYRTADEPMRVVSGRLDKPKVHFEAVPTGRVAGEMERFVGWFNESGSGGRAAMQPVARAGVAHLYFVSVHPFEDGNGRIARALSEMALSQGLGRPTLLALSQVIQDHKKKYYTALERNNKGLEVTDWLGYFGRTVLEAQRYTLAMVRFLIEKGRMLDRLRGELNARQEKALLRVFREGLGGFKGGLSAQNYMRITRASKSTATRDLQDLVEKGALRREGELRYTRYYLGVESVEGRAGEDG